MREPNALQRWLGVPLILIVAVALQAALFSFLPLFGAKPELALLVTVAVALALGSEWGAAAGFLGGFLIDLVGSLPLGISALSYSVVGYMVGWVAVYLPPSPFVPVAVAAAATLAGQTAVLGLSVLLGQGTRGVGIPQLLLTTVYNTVLATGVLPLVRWMLSPREARRS